MMLNQMKFFCLILLFFQRALESASTGMQTLECAQRIVPASTAHTHGPVSGATSVVVRSAKTDTSSTLPSLPENLFPTFVVFLSRKSIVPNSPALTNQRPTALAAAILFFLRRPKIRDIPLGDFKGTTVRRCQTTVLPARSQSVLCVRQHSAVRRVKETGRDVLVTSAAFSACMDQLLDTHTASKLPLCQLKVLDLVSNTIRIIFFLWMLFLSLGVFFLGGEGRVVLRQKFVNLI
jgi:hypothetical protein